MSAELTAFFFTPGSLARGGGAEEDDAGSGGADDERAGGADDVRSVGGADERAGGVEGERVAAASLTTGFSAEPADAPLLIGLLTMTRTAR
ncbi:MAG TPA: hypothetical protein VK509_07305 [Polyangiales bacterium]|nr:hypothetical protein [Polyangiales bacterium]